MSEEQKLASVKYLKLLFSSNSNHFLTCLSGIQVLNVFPSIFHWRKIALQVCAVHLLFSLGYLFKKLCCERQIYVKISYWYYDYFKKFSSAILFQKGVYFIIKEEMFRKGFFQPHLFCNSRASLND